MPLLEPAVHFLNQHIDFANAQMPLLLVAACSLISLALYVFTRGKEFIISGYASLLYLVPFIH